MTTQREEDTLLFLEKSECQIHYIENFLIKSKKLKPVYSFPCKNLVIELNEMQQSLIGSLKDTEEKWRSEYCIVKSQLKRIESDFWKIEQEANWVPICCSKY